MSLGRCIPVSGQRAVAGHTPRFQRTAPRFVVRVRIRGCHWSDCTSHQPEPTVTSRHWRTITWTALSWTPFSTAPLRSPRLELHLLEQLSPYPLPWGSRSESSCRLLVSHDVLQCTASTQVVKDAQVSVHPVDFSTCSATAVTLRFIALSHDKHSTPDSSPYMQCILRDGHLIADAHHSLRRHKHHAPLPFLQLSSARTNQEPAMSSQPPTKTEDLTDEDLEITFNGGNVNHPVVPVGTYA